MAQSAPSRRDRRAAVGVELMEARALLSTPTVGFAAAPVHGDVAPDQAAVIRWFEDPNE